MNPRLPSELLYDSEAALRLVDSAIEDIRERDPARDAALLAHGYTELANMVATLNRVRTHLDAGPAEAGPGERLPEASAALAQLETRLAALAQMFDAAATGR